MSTVCRGESYRNLRKPVPSPAGPSTRLIFQDMDHDVTRTPIRRQQPNREPPATVAAVSFPAGGKTIP
eukprot:1715243-Rhodomonas_salina.5